MTSGAARYKNNRKRGIKDRLVAATDPVENDRLSHAAELAFAARYGEEGQVQVERPSPCDLVVEHLRPSKGKPSKVVSHLDVKWSARLDAPLTRYAEDDDIARAGMAPHAAHICLVYVLIVGDDMRIVGWAWGHDLVKHWNPRLPRPAWSMPQSLLRPNIDLMMAATFGLAVAQT